MWWFTISVLFISRHVNCISAVQVFLFASQLNLQGGVLFIGAAPLDRWRWEYEEKQINLPDPPTHHSLSVCILCCSLPSPVSFHLALISLFNVLHFFFSSDPNMLTPLWSCKSSRRLLGSHAVIPHHKWAVWMCTQPTNQQPTWDPLHTVPQHSPN